jgi:hypothetical protein
MQKDLKGGDDRVWRKFAIDAAERARIPPLMENSTEQDF